MGLHLVQNGTTGAYDGDITSSGSRSDPVEFATLNTAVDVHIRTDSSSNYCASAYLVLGASGSLQVSTDGGSTWDGGNSSAVALPEFSYVNYALKMRQTATATSSAATFSTSATEAATSAITAVSDLTASALATSASGILVYWTSPANNSGAILYWHNATSCGTESVTSSTASSYQQSGLTSGSAYVYNISFSGTGRYTDSASSNTSSATTTVLWSVVDANTKALWTFADGTGSSATNTVASGKSITFTGSPTWDTSTGHGSGKGIIFDGSTQYGKVDKGIFSTDFGMTSSNGVMRDDVTIEMLVKPDTGATGRILSIAGGMSITYDTGWSGHFQWLDSGASYAWESATPNQTLTAGTWYHLALVKSNTDGLTLYINGTAAATYTGANKAKDIWWGYNAALGSAFYDIGIGASDSGASKFKGTIGWMRISDKARSSSEVGAMKTALGL